jgi:redox-sensitive bicupin YhaK (pirin superfamily)
MLDGHMRHEDHLGNRGDLKPGDVQWMTAARGIIHSEMPQQSAGRMRGFQLWINLPAREKMKPAHYRDIPASQIPVLELASGVRVKLIAGSVDLGSGPVSGPVNPAGAPLSTDPLYLDIHLPAHGEITVPVTSGHHAFIYLYEGDARVGPEDSARDLPARSGGVLSEDGAVRIQAGNAEARLLLLAARPINEPVVQYGPFVMNTRQEIEQAVEDFRSGRFAA